MSDKNESDPNDDTRMQSPLVKPQALYLIERLKPSERLPLYALANPNSSNHYTIGKVQLHAALVEIAIGYIHEQNRTGVPVLPQGAEAFNVLSSYVRSRSLKPKEAPSEPKADTSVALFDVSRTRKPSENPPKTTADNIVRGLWAKKITEPTPPLSAILDDINDTSFYTEAGLNILKTISQTEPQYFNSVIRDFTAIFPKPDRTALPALDSKASPKPDKPSAFLGDAVRGSYAMHLTRIAAEWAALDVSHNGTVSERFKFHVDGLKDKLSRQRGGID